MNHEALPDEEIAVSETVNQTKPQQNTTVHKPKTSNQSRSREEIAVDWIQAIGTLIVSVAIVFLTYQQMESAKQARAQDLQIAKDNRKDDSDRAKDEQQHEIMSNYLEQMTKLLLEQNLRDSSEGDEVRTVARAITLNATRRLDSERKGQLLKFLYEADLIGSCPSGSNPFQTERCPNNSIILKLNEVKLEGTKFKNPIELPGINLETADLSNAQLNNIGLTQAIMNSAVLEKADLSGAVLQQAEMRHITLNNAKLNRVSLFEANLQNATLFGATLTNAVLKNADLRCAQLQGVNLAGTDLTGAKLKGAAYDDNTTGLPKNFDKKANGMIKAEIGEHTEYTCAVR